jgi:hypothetical protein
MEKLSWLNRRIISAIWRRLSLIHSPSGELVFGFAPIWAVRFGWKVKFEFPLGHGKFSEWKLFRWMRSGVFSNKTLKLRGMHHGNRIVLQMCQIADVPGTSEVEMGVVDITKEEHPSFISSVGGSIANRFEVMQQFTGAATMTIAIRYCHKTIGNVSSTICLAVLLSSPLYCPP